MATEPIDLGLIAGDEINLYAPRLPDGKENVAGADYGLAIRFYNDKPQGAAVIVRALLEQKPNMSVFLNLNGVNKIASALTESETSDTTLYIPHNLLLPDRLNTLNYTVRRLDSSEETYEPLTTIAYNEIPPGEYDESPGDGEHSRLIPILPKHVIDDGIDAEIAEQGVQAYCMYPYCRPGDEITVQCNAHVLTHVVHPDEAPSTPTNEPTIIGVWLDKAFWEAAGDGPHSSFKFTVKDELTNPADPRSPWSKSIPLVIDLKSARMTAPNIAVDPDDPNEHSGTIDWNKLGTRDLTVEVHVFAPFWKIDDTVRGKYTATPSTGSAIEHEVEVKVTRLPFTHRMMIPNAKVIADSTVKAFYECIRENAVIANSKNARARVIQKPVITSMKNSFNEELENGGTVSDNKVMLSGSALAGVVLQVFDADTFKGEVTVGTNYKWQSLFIPIAEGQHSFTVKEKNGNQFESGPWAIERLAFSINRTQMKLDGFSVRVDGWPKTGEDSIGNTGVRVPIGGVPPYDWASSEPLIAPVTAEGKFVGLKNGVATAYVTDQEGTTLSFLVVVTNKHKLHISPTPLRIELSIEWMNSLGGVTTYNSDFIRDILRVYQVPARNYSVWTCLLIGGYGRAISANNTLYATITSAPWVSWCLTLV
ncbi:MULTISPECIES: hypothetical protein [unclassified Pseudomonas]|uniref:hypothetical protein n=1 Tax=unclassified Pseudomonas TaxID=196821 RepID=UPI000A1F9AC4|nr:MULTISPECIES: hypothetical protein [unclassified Pseudomonas]